MKIYIFRFVISIFMFLISLNGAFAQTYVSLSPVFTEIIYAINGEENLLGVSSTCDYPINAKQKPIVGDAYFVNTEMIVKLKPDYLFAMDSARPKLGELSLTATKPVYFDFKNIEDIYSAIYKIAQYADRKQNAQTLIEDIKYKVEQSKTQNPKRILYLVQVNPVITIGKNSFLTDVIKKSGHISVTEDIKYYYPEITMEYVVKQKPDLIIVCFESDLTELKKLMPDTPIIELSAQDRDILSRPGPRIYEAVKLFADLNIKP